MAKDKTKDINRLREIYGARPDSYKYILHGAEIFRYLGMNVVHVKFSRPNKESEWETKLGIVTLLRAENYDPMTMTYDLIYTEEGSEGEKTTKIVPEGYSWGDSETTMERFLPVSIHTTLGEDIKFVERVGQLYESKKTMSIDDLLDIAKSKEQAVTLRYNHNIGAAVKLETGDYLWVRIHTLKLFHKAGEQYCLRFSDDKQNWVVMINKSDETYDFSGLGRFKILDLAY